MWIIYRAHIVLLFLLLLLVDGILAGCGGSTEGTAEWHFDQGQIFTQQGRYNEAIEEYDEAIRLNPQYAEAYLGRGIAYGNLGKHERAIEDYDGAICLNPQYADAYYNRGLAFYSLDQYVQAIHDLNEAVRLNP